MLVYEPELSLVVGHTLGGAVLGGALQHHNVDRPGGVSSAGPDPTLPVPRKTGVDVCDGQCTEEKKRKVCKDEMK